MKDLNTYTGVDVSQEISLFEYGILWKENEYCEDNELLFILKVGDKFNSGYISESDLNWIDKDDILSYTGMSETEWDKLPLGHKVHDVCNYYGANNLMPEYDGITEQEIRKQFNIL